MLRRIAFFLIAASVLITGVIYETSMYHRPTEKNEKGSFERVFSSQKKDNTVFYKADKDNSDAGPASENIVSAIKRLRIPFVLNQGQVSDNVKFYAKTFAGTVAVTSDGEIVYSISQKRGNLQGKIDNKQRAIKEVSLKELLTGGKTDLIKGEGETVTKVNYFRGNDPSNWRSNVPAYEVVSLGEVYDGIELKLKAYGSNVEKLFYVKPEAIPENIKVRMEGAKSLRVNNHGELVVETGDGEIKYTKPVAYQQKDHETGGKDQIEYIEVAYIINGNEYGFELGAYDKSKELVIDPLLASSFLGGSDNDFGSYIATDKNGNIYVAGETLSPDFPVTNSAYPASRSVGYSDVFVAKLSGDLTTLLAATYLGGSDGDGATSIAIDRSGEVYVCGYTLSPDFPTTSGAYSVIGRGTDAFIARLSGDLTALIASTYLGGSSDDYAYSVSVIQNDIYIAGETRSLDFPVTNGVYAETYGGGFSDAFISRLSSDLTSLKASTYLGGSDDDYAYSMGSDIEGNIYIAGTTLSSDFPAAFGSYSAFNNNYDVFVSKLSGALTTLLASTYLGGSNDDGLSSMSVDQHGDVYLCGWTSSSDFPTTAGAYSVFSRGGYSEAFVSKLSDDLTTLLASTYLGGSDDEYAYSMSFDPAGNVYVTGGTMSPNFPTTVRAYATTYNSYNDGFVSKFSGDLTTLLASTYLGGNDEDYPLNIFINQNGDVYLTGFTLSFNFPVTSGAYDNLKERYEAFISKLDFNLSAAFISPAPAALDFGIVRTGTQAAQYITINNTDPQTDLLIDSVIIVSNNSIFNVQTGGTNPCTSLAPTIPPLGSCTVRINFMPDSDGEQSAMLRMASNGSNGPYFDVPITGTGIRLYSLSVTKTGKGSGNVTSAPAGIDCGPDCSDEYRTNTMVTLTSAADAGSVFTGWSGCDNPNGNICGVAINMDKIVTAIFQLAPAPEIVIKPHSLNFGAVKAGSSKTKNLKIRNKGKAPLVISSVVADSSEFSAVWTGQQTIMPKQIYNLTVTFSPIKRGPKDAILSIYSNDPAAPVKAVPLDGVGR